MNKDKKERLRKNIQKSKNNAYNEKYFDTMITAMDNADRVKAVKEARAMLQTGLRAALDFVNHWW